MQWCTSIVVDNVAVAAVREHVICYFERSSPAGYVNDGLGKSVARRHAEIEVYILCRLGHEKRACNGIMRIDLFLNVVGMCSSPSSRFVEVPHFR